MLQTFRFYSPSYMIWLVDLPQYIESGVGTIDNLYMVCGADRFLETLSNGTREVLLELSETPFEGSTTLELKRFGFDSTDDEGAWYNLHEYNGVVYQLDMWLCGVTLFVFGHYPSRIYFRKKEK